MHSNQANAMMEKAAYANAQAQYGLTNQIGPPPPAPTPSTVIAAACMEFDKNRQCAAEIARRLESLADRLWGCEPECGSAGQSSPPPSGEVGEMTALSVELDSQMNRIFRALNRVERV